MPDRDPIRRRYERMHDRALGRVSANRGTSYPCSQSVLDLLRHPLNNNRRKLISLEKLVTEAIMINEERKPSPRKCAARDRIWAASRIPTDEWEGDLM